MVFWLDNIPKLRNIILLIIEIISFFESLQSMNYATRLIIMFIVSPSKLEKNENT